MKKLFTIVLTLLLLTGSVNFVLAAYVDIRPNNPDPVSPGDDFDVEIWLVGDITEYVGPSYSFDVGFDPNELSLRSEDPLSATEAWRTGYMDIAALAYEVDHVVWNFDGFTFNNQTLEDPFYLGTIGFTVGTPLEDGNDDVFAQYRTGQGVTINDVILWIDSEGPDIAAVPIPGALWLMGSGLLGLLGIRRRSKN